MPSGFQFKEPPLPSEFQTAVRGMVRIFSGIYYIRNFHLETLDIFSSGDKGPFIYMVHCGTPIKWPPIKQPLPNKLPVSKVPKALPVKYCK